MDSGVSVITQKFVQTGGDDFGGESLDIHIHRQIMGIEMTDRDKDHTTAPCIFSYPASPHLAAEMDNREIDFDYIDRCKDTLQNEYDILLIEGAGGLIIPLTNTYTSLDYVIDRNLPLIVVTSGRLGSINHTLLTLEIAKIRGLEVAFVAYNHHFDNDEKISKSTHEYISAYIKKEFPKCQLIDIESI